jgi:hypothetical protein
MLLFIAEFYVCIKAFLVMRKRAEEKRKAYLEN